MSLVIHTVKWQNFLGTGSTGHTLDLDQHSTTIFQGENGAGKSTIMDAVCYGLYNRGFRKVKNAQLINSIVGRRMVVEIEFSSDNIRYRVVRGLKPAIFEIYQQGSLLNRPGDSRDYQAILEQNVLKINYKTFIQIVVLGNANFMPFMQMYAHHRREIIESLLDIRVFTTMNGILKAKVQAALDQAANNDREIAIIQNTLQLKEKHHQQLLQQHQQSIEQKNEELDSNQQKIEQLQQQNDQLNRQIAELTKTIAGRAKLAGRLSKGATTIHQISDRIKSLQDRASFYQQNDSCPTCSQQLDSKFKQNKLTKIDQQIEKLKQQKAAAEKLIVQLTDKLDQYQQTMQKIDGLSSSIVGNSQEIGVRQSINKQIRDQINKLHSKQVQITDGKATRQKLQKLQAEKAELASRFALFDVAAVLLKDDGIKTNIVRQYIPVINQLINKHLEQMGFFCQFELNEQFEETIKSRYRDNFSYESFSEGQKKRIDIALLFCWRELAKMRNSASCNLLILDEVLDGSLDVAGMMSFAESIAGHHSNIIVISHRSEQLDNFDRAFEFKLQKNFTSMEQIQ